MPRAVGPAMAPSSLACGSGPLPWASHRYSSDAADQTPRPSRACRPRFAPLCPAMPRYALYRHHSAIHHTSCTPPRQALELGAGVGVSGIVLAELGARVTLTDCFPPILALLRRNVAQNAGGGLARRASVQP